MALFRDIVERAEPKDIPLIPTDGFEFYERVVGQVFGPACVYDHGPKTRQNNRIVKVERRRVIGTEGRLEEKLQRSKDSSTLNTSFIERLNLTIRQGSAYLCTPAGSKVWKGIRSYLNDITISSVHIGR